MSLNFSPLYIEDVIKQHKGDVLSVIYGPLQAHKEAIIQSKLITAEHILLLLKDPNSAIRELAIESRVANEECILVALDDPNWFVRKAAMYHDNLTKKCIDAIYNHWCPTVRSYYATSQYYYQQNQKLLTNIVC